jgi:hypothetical protein
VLETEPRPIADLRRGAPVNYNAPDRTLDPATLDSLMAWLAIQVAR